MTLDEAWQTMKNICMGIQALRQDHQKVDECIRLVGAAVELSKAESPIDAKVPPKSKKR